MSFFNKTENVLQRVKNVEQDLKMMQNNLDKKLDNVDIKMDTILGLLQQGDERQRGQDVHSVRPDI